MAPASPHKPRRRTKISAPSPLPSSFPASPSPSTPSTPKRETKASSLSTGKTKSGRNVRFGATTTGEFRGSRKLSYNSDVKKPGFPLEAFMWAGRGASQWVVLPLVLMVVGLFRWAAGLWGYSGFLNPPMFGDYEAQRHWMEVTTQLPISHWYFHDLQWWGLDYPPLTAYHSWMLGKIGALIDPSWFALYTSRGLHDDTLKVFMRATVIVSEYLVYIPAAVIFVRRFSRLQGVQSWDASIALVAILLQPSTILIDHVHFQYNTVMLGLVLASTSSILAGRYMWSAVFFVLALGFKQMALYYAPAVFAYLLGICVFPRVNLPRLIGIASVTLATFILLLLPLLLGAVYDYHRGIISPELHGHVSPLPVLTALFEEWNIPYTLAPIQQLAQMTHRIFPFARGLFEDKVANFWCALNIIYKLKHYPTSLLQKASLALTLASILPPCTIIFLKPKKELFPLALATTAWGFFLFSFQVHEKSVLLPLLPMTLLLAGKDGLTPATRAWVGWANNVAVWTLFPLLERVELRVPYAVLALLWAYLLGLPPVDWSVYAGLWRVGKGGKAVSLLHGLFYAAMVVWHGVEAWVQAPETLPDLWVVANVGVGAVAFGIAYIWCLWTLLDGSGLLGEKSQTKKVVVKKK